MKTESKNAGPAGPQPGNLSTQQLARALTKPVPATPPAQDPQTAPEPQEPQEPTREPAPAHHGAAPAVPADPPTVDPHPEPQPEAPAEPQPGDAPAAPAEPEPGAEPQPGDAPAAPARAELPQELQDAMELAKGDGKKGVADLLKRVHHLVDERDTERNARLSTAEENKQLRTELLEARKGRTAPAGPAGTSPEVAAVVNELTNVDHWLSVCEDAISEQKEIEVPQANGGTLKLDRQQIAALHRQLQNDRQELVARKVQVEADAKANYKTEYATHHATALQSYPWIQNPKAPEHAEMQEILKVFPTFKQAPDYELAIGDFLAGKALRLAKAKAKANGSAPRPVPPAREPTRVPTEPPGGGAAPTQAATKKAQEQESTYRKTGRTADLAKSFAAQSRARRAA